MKSFYLNKAAVAAATALAAVAPALAQSSVTLYGIVDDSIAYQSSQTSLGSTSGGRSNVKMASGIWAGSRFGLKGAEDLGGGTKAIFQLESGFNMQHRRAAIHQRDVRPAGMGRLTNPTYGTLTAGRQYTSYYTLLSPYSPTTWLTGYFGAHPGDLDALDTIYRANNSLVYTSPKLYGLTVSGSYSFAGVPGSVNQRLDVERRGPVPQRPVRVAVALHAHQQLDAGRRRVRRGFDDEYGRPVGRVGGDERLSDARRRSSASRSRAATRSTARGTCRRRTRTCSTSRASARSSHDGRSSTRPAPCCTGRPRRLGLRRRLQLHARDESERHRRAPRQYQQFNLSQYYALSKRTGLYALQAFQRANGQTLGTDVPGAEQLINATATFGDGFQIGAVVVAQQFAAGVGIVHRF